MVPLQSSYINDIVHIIAKNKKYVIETDSLPLYQLPHIT
jgi:hypothetical protein